MLSLTLFLACGTHAAPPAPVTQAPPGFWDHWGDGQGELAGYRLTQPRYGEPRSGEAVLVTVTETFTGAGRVKSDGGHGDEYPVVKLNEVRDFQTGIYDYNVLTSVFLRLDGVDPLGLPNKVSFSLQEWCGHVYEELAPTGVGLTQLTHSYFDGESVGSAVHDTPRGGVVADAMPMLVRGLGGPLLAPGERREVPWLASALDRRLHHRPVSWATAVLSLASDTSSTTVPAGTFTTREWTARPSAGPVSQWWVEVDPPHRLVRWARDDGEVGELTGVTRRRYWQDKREGDEALRAELGLTP
ncbi:MAG: hypothetical protein ACI8PZ_005208 [Myxococcota bacterium]|jgi:hypothetical protein